MHYNTKKIISGASKGSVVILILEVKLLVVHIGTTNISSKVLLERRTKGSRRGSSSNLLKHAIDIQTSWN